MSWNGITRIPSNFLNREQADLAYMITDFGIGELRLVRWLTHVLGWWMMTMMRRLKQVYEEDTRWFYLGLGLESVRVHFCYGVNTVISYHVHWIDWCDMIWLIDEATQQDDLNTRRSNSSVVDFSYAYLCIYIYLLYIHYIPTFSGVRQTNLTPMSFF